MCLSSIPFHSSQFWQLRETYKSRNVKHVHTYTNEPRRNRCAYTNRITRYSTRLIRIDKARRQPRGAMPRNTDQRRESLSLYRPGKISYNVTVLDPRTQFPSPPRFNQATSFAQLGTPQDLDVATPMTPNAATAFSFSPGRPTDILPERLLVGAAV